jgi:hypothetical protein
VILCIKIASLYCCDTFKFEGFIHKSQILVGEEKYILYLLEPVQVLLPTNVEEKVYFVVLQMSDELEKYVTQYVKVEGFWQGILLPLLNLGPILRVDQISADHWINYAKPNNEERIEYLEKCIPNFVSTACHVARFEALFSGFNVIEVEGNELVEINPDGSKRVIESLLQRTVVKPGTKLIIKIP